MAFATGSLVMRLIAVGASPSLVGTCPTCGLRVPVTRQGTCVRHWDCRVTYAPGACCDGAGLLAVNVLIDRVYGP